MFLPVALLVKIGIVILLWGEALRTTPIPPPACLFSRHSDTLAFPYIYINISIHIYIYIYR